jgi:hypothetical protein
MNTRSLDPSVWGPHYWFFLHTIAISYPLIPTKENKKKYYDFINNLYLFIPDHKIGNKFNKLLNKYPVLPYLDSKQSFMKWVHFIHNKVNTMLGKKNMSYQESLENYYKNYIPIQVISIENTKNNKIKTYGLILIILLGIGYYLYNK